jgi:HEAT repeat protein
MTKSLEERLAELYALRDAPPSDEALAKLRHALSLKTNHLVAAAAKIIADLANSGELEITALENDLVQAFERFMVNAEKTDKGCAAKMAIAEALYRLDVDQTALFLRGIRHVQLEPTYGGKEDTAAPLRGVCAMGLVHRRYPHVMLELAHLLADAESDARIAAARAIAYAQQEEAGAPLLHLKILSGDENPQVRYECFYALLQLAPTSSLTFVADFLYDDDPTTCEAAALALGESRLKAALDPLKAAWEKTFDPDLRHTLLLAIAMLRHEAAIDFLLSLIAEASPANAQDAVKALDMYRRDRAIWQRVQKLIDKREDLDIT